MNILFQMSRWFRKRSKQPSRVERVWQLLIDYQQYKTQLVLLYFKMDKLSKREHMPNSWVLKVSTTSWSSLKVKSVLTQPNRCANWHRDALPAKCTCLINFMTFQESRKSRYFYQSALRPFRLIMPHQCKSTTLYLLICFENPANLYKPSSPAGEERDHTA